jgi:hypothetical protein
MKTLDFTPLLPITSLSSCENNEMKSGIAMIIHKHNQLYIPVCLLKNDRDIVSEIESKIQTIEYNVQELYFSILFCKRLMFFPAKQILVLELEHIQEYVVSNLKLEYQERFYDNIQLLISDIDIISQYLKINLPTSIENVQYERQS